MAGMGTGMLPMLSTKSAIDYTQERIKKKEAEARAAAAERQRISEWQEAMANRMSNSSPSISLPLTSPQETSRSPLKRPSPNHPATKLFPLSHPVRTHLTPAPRSENCPNHLPLRQDRRLIPPNPLLQALADSNKCLASTGSRGRSPSRMLISALSLEAQLGSRGH